MQAGKDPQFDPGPFGKTGGRPEILPIDVLAGVLSAVWLVATFAYFWRGAAQENAAGLVLTVLVVLLPLVLIWAAAITLRAVRTLRAEARRLQASVDAMRQALAASQQAAATSRPTTAERRPDDSPPPARLGEAAQAGFASRRDAAATQPSANRKAALVSPQPDPSAEQIILPLGTPAEDLHRPLTAPEFVRALQFPESPDDKEGFRALRLALEDRELAKLIRAAQDVLTLLSQEGIYMDDLTPDRAHPDLWRRFAGGERGRAIAGLGGIRDRSSLTLTAARMREDAIFRDAAHHFLRSFDRSVAAFEKTASDADLADLSETRTARAFMVLGRVSGIFD
ncbi:MAG: hypothetical protein ACT4N9_07145 [Paracoccaceae bacterium]